MPGYWIGRGGESKFFFKWSLKSEEWQGKLRIDPSQQLLIYKENVLDVKCNWRKLGGGLEGGGGVKDA